MSFNNFGWGAPITVKGETGATGATGATGPQGPQGNPTTITSADTNLLTVSTVGSTATLTPTSNIMTTNTDQAVNSVKTFDSECLEINDLKLAADGSIMTFPTGDDTVITSLATQDLVNKGLNMELGYFYSNTGANRKVMFRFTPVAPVGNNTTSEIRFASTASRLWTHPDKSGTYAMTIDLPNQALDTSSSPTFATQTLTTGLLLPTTGGTPTSLNYYEEGTFNLTFTGPHTTIVSCNFCRVGKLVNFNMNWSYLAASAGGFFTTSGLPARLTPAIAIDSQVWVADNSVWQTTPGRILVAGTSISIYRLNQSTTFTAAGTAAFGNWSWTWRI